MKSAVSRVDWAYLTRAGSERDLIDELGDPSRVEAEGVVVGGPRPKRRDGHLDDPVFARQAMRRPHATPPAPGPVARALQPLLAKVRLRPGEEEWTWALQVVAPDSTDPEDPRRPIAESLEAGLEGAFSRWADRLRPAAGASHLLQAWVVDEARVFSGLTPTGLALSYAPAGRLRLERPADAVSRSGLKLEEAILWCGAGPEKGDIVADLGAAPGGWSQVALSRGATVIAVDLGRVKVDAPTKRFAHLEENAFRYAPPETLDWVICDMAYRPLEVAKLLAKWGRRSWARQLIANIKLPMKKKAEIVRQVLEILEAGGWNGLKARQLYHDRDEVTLFGWLSPGPAHRPAQAPFALKSAGTGAAGAGPRPRPGPRGRGKGRRDGPRGGADPRRGSPRGRKKSGPRKRR